MTDYIAVFDFKDGVVVKELLYQVRSELQEKRAGLCEHDESLRELYDSQMRAASRMIAAIAQADTEEAYGRTMLDVLLTRMRDALHVTGRDAREEQAQRRKL